MHQNSQNCLGAVLRPDPPRELTALSQILWLVLERMEGAEREGSVMECCPTLLERLRRHLLQVLENLEPNVTHMDSANGLMLDSAANRTPFAHNEFLT